MKRRQLWEWEDQPWLPEALRNYITDHLRHALLHPSRAPIHLAIAKRLKGLLAGSGQAQIIDLCSGAGGPLEAVLQQLHTRLRTPAQVLLTDLYPNHTALAARVAEGGGSVRAHPQPVDAGAVPEALKGVRTVFTAFHHFAPAQAQRLLADAAAAGQPIAIFEPLQRRPRQLLIAAAQALFSAFALTPRVGRLSATRLLLTYLLPIAPLLLLWDSCISVLRSYTPEELRALAAAASAPGYEWEAGEFEAPGPFGLWMPTVFLIGRPVAAAA